MKQNAIRLITGLIIIIIGVGALLGALNIIPFWSWFGTLWPLLIVLGGIFVLIGDLRRNYLWGILLIIIGGLLYLRALGLFDFNFFSLIVPILIIGAGLSILLNSKSRTPTTSSAKDTDDISVIFSGSETLNKSKDYKGGKATAIFGGASIDLRDARITKEATLDVFAFCGGLEIRVPREWRVISKVAPIAGGVENKSQGSDEHTGPVLILTGTIVMGGIEIKT